MTNREVFVENTKHETAAQIAKRLGITKSAVYQLRSKDGNWNPSDEKLTEWFGKPETATVNVKRMKTIPANTLFDFGADIKEEIFQEVNSHLQYHKMKVAELTTVLKTLE